MLQIGCWKKLREYYKFLLFQLKYYNKENRSLSSPNIWIALQVVVVMVDYILTSHWIEVNLPLL